MKMSTNLKSHLKLLELLCCSNPETLKILINKSDNNFILAVCEVIKNFKEGNFDCKKKNLRKLKKFKTQIYKLSNTSKSSKNLKNQRKILSQKGKGFLPLILAPFLVHAAEYFVSNLTRKK